MARSKDKAEPSPEALECIATLSSQGNYELVAIVIPSHTKKKKQLPYDEQAGWAKEALELFANLFTGATCFDTFQGVFKTAKGEILWDKPRIVESLAPVERLSDPSHISQLLQFAKRLGRSWFTFNLSSPIRPVDPAAVSPRPLLIFQHPNQVGYRPFPIRNSCLDGWRRLDRRMPLHKIVREIM